MTSMRYPLILLTTLLLLGTGCTGTPDRNAYVAVGTTTATFSQTIHAFDEWRALHPLTPAQAQTYANLLRAYRDSLAAVRAAKLAASNPLVSTNAYATSQAAWETALDISSAAAAKLGTFIADLAPLLTKSTH